MKRKRENIREENDHGGTCPETSSSNTNNSLNNDTNNNKEQDRFLPIANVGRIMKKVIPGNGKISKEAKETVQECVSEFISFVTGEASDKCQREKRKTINGDDILWAIITLGFEAYVDPLKIYLTKYRDMEGQKLNVPKQQQIDQQQNHQNLGFGGGGGGGRVYSSAVSQPSFMAANDHNLFPLPFSQPSSLPKQDNNEHW